MKAFDTDDGRKLNGAADRMASPIVAAVGVVATAVAVGGPLNTPLVSLQNMAAISTRSDTFTGTGAGTIVGRTTNPVKTFALQVTGTGTQFGVTTWTVVLEGSLDGVTWTTICQHVYPTQSDGETVFLGATWCPSLYFRSNCTALVKGTATNIVAIILGLP